MTIEATASLVKALGTEIDELVLLARALVAEREEARLWARKLYQEKWQLLREMEDYKSRAADDIAWLEGQLIDQDNLIEELNRRDEMLVELDDDNELLQECKDISEDISAGRLGMLQMVHDMLHEIVGIESDFDDDTIFDIDMPMDIDTEMYKCKHEGSPDPWIDRLAEGMRQMAEEVDRKAVQGTEGDPYEDGFILPY